MRYRENGNLEFLYYCFNCKKQHSLEISDRYKEALDEWRSGELIQNTQLGELGLSTREILISQICPECQDEIFIEQFGDQDEFIEDDDIAF